MSLSGQAPAVVAVVLNWNLPEETISCIRNLQESDIPNLEIVVVDNGSTDGSVDRLRREFPKLDVVSLSTNLGFAAGSNVGIRYALAHGTPWILLVNNDAVLAPDAIRRLIAAAEPGSAAMPRIDALPSRRLWHAGARAHKLTGLPVAVSERDLAAGEVVDLDYVVGCVLLIHRDLVARVGLFDEKYFMYYEDLDFSLRARTAGCRLLLVPGARAWHKVGASLENDRGRRAYLLTRQKTLWCRGRSLGIAAIAWWLSLAAGVLRRVAVATFERRLDEVGLVLRGLRDGFVGDAPGISTRIPRE